MPGGPTHEPGVWQQFRRRRVIRVVIAYLAVAFAGLEASWFLEASGFFVSYFQLPEWSSRAVLGAAVLGFPVTVALAWTYDITPDGIVRTPDELGPETPQAPVRRPVWLVLSLGALLAGLILHLIRT